MAEPNFNLFQGDSGGAIRYYDQRLQKNFIVGIVHGAVNNCNGRRFPPIFVNVADYKILSWIYERVFTDITIQPPKTSSISKWN